MAGQIYNRHVVGGDAEGHASELPIVLRDDLAHGLGSASRSRDDVLGSPSAITPQLPGGAIHSLLGGSDSVDSGHESLHDAKVVMDDLGRVVVQEALLTILRVLLYFSWFMPITNMGPLAEGSEMMTLLAPPFK